jgi:hypothetical protein
MGCVKVQALLDGPQVDAGVGHRVPVDLGQLIGGEVRLFSAASPSLLTLDS